MKAIFLELIPRPEGVNFFQLFHHIWAVSREHVDVLKWEFEVELLKYWVTGWETDLVDF